MVIDASRHLAVADCHQDLAVSSGHQWVSPVAFRRQRASITVSRCQRASIAVLCCQWASAVRVASGRPLIPDSDCWSGPFLSSNIKFMTLTVSYINDCCSHRTLESPKMNPPKFRNLTTIFFYYYVTNHKYT